MPFHKIRHTKKRMNFICNQSKLSRALNIVSKAVSSRTSIPILRGIMIEIKEDSLILAASDLDISIIKNINVKSSQNGKFVVNAKLFSDIIRKLPNGDIEFLLNEDKLTIKCFSSEFELVVSSADDFPEMKTGTYEETMIFDKNLFRDIIRRTTFAASIDESKGIITGTLIELENNSLKMVAIDGFRMAVNKAEITENYNGKIIVSSRILNDIGKIISESDEEVDFIKFSIGNNSASVILGSVTVNLRLMEGEFIKYNDVLPKNNPIKVKINRHSLNESIERASLLSKEGKNNLIKLDFKEGIMAISSRSDEGSVVEEVMIEKEGDDLEIGFNAKYLSDILKVIDDEEIVMHLNTPISPCLVMPAEDTDKFEFLILPVRITKTI